MISARCRFEHLPPHIELIVQIFCCKHFRLDKFGSCQPPCSCEAYSRPRRSRLQGNFDGRPILDSSTYTTAFQSPTRIRRNQTCEFVQTAAGFLICSSCQQFTAGICRPLNSPRSDQSLAARPFQRQFLRLDLR